MMTYLKLEKKIIKLNIIQIKFLQAIKIKNKIK